MAASLAESEKISHRVSMLRRVWDGAKISAMSLNYSFMIDLVDRMVGPSARILDYGCGEGQIVKLALARGYDAYGCDSYDGMWSMWTDAASQNRITKITDTILFSEATFDVVIANQVFEHIDDFNRPLSEIHRVLKPGGLFINSFPTLEAWWEGHQKAPFAQHFFSSPETWKRYLRVMHWIRIGPDRNGRTAAQWIEGCKHLPDICFYKQHREVEHIFSTLFDILPGAEPEWIRHRLRNSKSLSWILPPRICDPLMRFLCSRLASRVYVLRRKDHIKSV